MRTGAVILSVLVLLWGFLQAPFEHIHPEELEHRATSALVHVHVRETLAGHGWYVAPRTADDDEIDVQWSVAISAAVVLHADAALSGWAPVRNPLLASLAVLVPWHRGHDPPQFSPQIPRAPPA